MVCSALLAGWCVNAAADVFPVEPALGKAWRRTARRILLLERARDNAVGAPRARRWQRYLLVWLAALLIGILIDGQIGWTGVSALVALQAWCFLAIAVIDWEHHLVLNRMLLPAAPVLALCAVAAGNVTPLSSLAGATAGFGVFIVLALLRPGSMGMGDVKLAGAVGLVAGLQTIGTALLVTFIAGGVAAFILLVRSRFESGQRMAYAPYLALGAWVSLFLHTL